MGHEDYWLGPEEGGNGLKIVIVYKEITSVIVYLLRVLDMCLMYIGVIYFLSAPYLNNGVLWLF